MGAQVTVLDVQASTMAYLEDIFGGAVETLYSNPINIENAVMRADLFLIVSMSQSSFVCKKIVDHASCDLQVRLLEF